MGRQGSGEEAGIVSYTYRCICTLHIAYLSIELVQFKVIWRSHTHFKAHCVIKIVYGLVMWPGRT